MQGRHPSGTQVQIMGGEVVSQSYPSEPHPERPQPQLHLAIRDLDGTQIREALKELQLETARREQMAPPIGSPLGQWWAPPGAVEADLDDGEVALQGGRDGDPASWCSGPWAPLSSGGCWSPPQHAHSYTKVWYPKN